jgi:hypothetical protein
MCRYTSKCGENKAYLDWSGQVCMESRWGLGRVSLEGQREALIYPSESVER